jgi:hypothetical protein
MTDSSARPANLDTHQADGRSNGEAPRVTGSRWARIKTEWRHRLQPGEQSVVIAWSSFTATFIGVRALTHWIRAGHGPSGGGISIGGEHFHHYNIGIGLLSTIGAIALRGEERHRRHPMTAVAYGSALALIVDELALLMDLRDVYWAREGRESVDAAVILVAAGGTLIAGMPFWPYARHALSSTA